MNTFYYGLKKILYVFNRKQRRDVRNDGTPSSYQPCTLLVVLKIASIAFAVGGTLILGWVVVQLHTEINSLTEKLASSKITCNKVSITFSHSIALFSVSTSSNDETILELKRSIKELSLNGSFNYKAMQNCSKFVNEFQSQVSGFSTDLKTIKDSLKETPNMLNIGKELESLKASLATFEATLSDLKLNLHDPPSALPSIQLNALNTTLQGQIALINEDLHHNHVRFLTVILSVILIN